MIENIDNPSALDLLARFQKYGPNEEYKNLQAKLGVGTRRAQTSYWNFISDAVDATGGYSNGFYLYPFAKELEANTNRITENFKTRREQATYDNFARDICLAAWDQIVQSKDLIVRQSEGEARLDQFWKNSDGQGNDIMAFNEFVQKQSRMYGTGFALMDRPEPGDDQLDTEGNPTAQYDPTVPYVTAIPSQRIVGWNWDEDNELDGLVIFEPLDYVETNPDFDGFRGYDFGRPHRLCIWTNTEYLVAQMIPTGTASEGQASTSPTASGKAGSGVDYTIVMTGINNLGTIPLVRLFNDDPGPRRMFGESEMFEVARMAQQVFNIDSEKREIERKCAMFLAMPVKDVQAYQTEESVIGQNNLFLYDGEAGAPHWITPDMKPVEILENEKKSIVDACYNMAHLRAMVGSIQTRSGFHAEVEFQKTERRIARNAAQLESFEMQMTRLFGQFVGKSNNATVQYPREYGVRDIEKMIQRTTTLIALNLGKDVEALALQQLFKVLYSRKSDAEIKTLTDSATAALEKARQEQLQMALGGNVKPNQGPNQVEPDTSPTPQARVRSLVGRTIATQAATALRQGAQG